MRSLSSKMNTSGASTITKVRKNCITYRSKYVVKKLFQHVLGNQLTVDLI